LVRDEEERVVDRAAGEVGVELVDADDEVDALLASSAAQGVGRGARHRDGVPLQACEGAFRARLVPLRGVVDPARGAGDPRLGKRHEPRAFAGSLLDQTYGLLDRRLAVEEDRGGLDGRRDEALRLHACLAYAAGGTLVGR